MKVLLSIKPEFVDKIFCGEKKYEFRRSIFKRQEVKKIVVYASAPISKVIGEFEVDHILAGDIFDLWEQTKKFAGITEEYFFNYFSGLENGYAIKIKKYVRYLKPYCIEEQFGLKPPQSFVYI
ncbi:MAG: hypothetical protein DWB56_06545 [Candidatus Jettenia sp.]|uniref:hypothetical protein n=1 Tax=Candidatus Jettenia sp. AMX1 TaxID=2293637 RepID=UPI0002D89E03|nr:hypothetical protein [Candidatus Jettenia sp. AMX1]MBC6928614.1 hypothetical protein [Candidatus Jettenia sp.]NUN22204.1 hypothetical protein [Candidatus Jettenia caeni]KAA0249871.1 MAG: hypothetical protein EDM77_07260 [Candidatus Jettenia sp. AMX1]MCE7880601.1 hypothetical protein [Candidatus Jettenia sp. AMX1]MCQ3927247.1 hypothetical protein [Candidatus Jettenia sp.]